MKDKFSPEHKAQALEAAVIKKTPKEVSRIFAELGEVGFSARALGLACRYRGLDMVKALIEGGACFDNFIGTNHRYENVWLTVNGVSAREVREGLPNYALMLLDNTQAGYCAEGVSEKDIPIIPVTARLGIVDHLCENAEKCGFDGGDLLYFSILTNSGAFYKRLKKHGIVLNENIKTALTIGAAGVDWQRFQIMIMRLGSEELMSIVKTLLRELDTEKMKFTMALYFDHSYRFESSPEAFDFFLGNFNQSKMNKTAILKDIISRELIPCLSAAEKHGWLGDTKKRDEMIKYASDNGKTESTAWLLDFKNRTADLAVEKKKAETKMLRELNADPTSLSEIKKSFRFTKKKDGTLLITSYSGHSTSIVVPEKIGEDKVTEIGDWAFSPHQNRTREQTSEFRKTITKITLPNGLKRIGDSAFDGLISLESVNIPKTVRFIGEYAFLDCNALKRIIVPEGVRDIDANAFAVQRGMGALEYVELPSTLKYFREDCDWWRVYLFESSSCPKL
ncbi:MAG: leucine-rich repeat domain-containing protein, partial [Oscillospiraceae bacterium]|nr:leucine-rich repeat domain-containing protein [Oscillospiraceae bacterium]